MQQPVLVPLDGSNLAEQALPYAEKLAGSLCELILLEVGEDEDDEFGLQERHGDSCARLEAVTGDPVEQILQVAQELDPGLIVMTTMGRGASGRSPLGHVAGAVTRRSPVPVLIVRPKAEDTGGAQPVIQRLVVPLDGSPLAEMALPVAESLAKRLQLPVHLMAVVNPTNGIPEQTSAETGVEPPASVESFSGLDEDANAMLTRISPRLAAEGLQVSSEVLHGSPDRAIDEASKPGDVIVMTNHGRSGARSSLLGSVAEKLIRNGSSPVLLVPASQQGDELREVTDSDEPGDVTPVTSCGAEPAAREEVDHVR